MQNDPRPSILTYKGRRCPITLSMVWLPEPITFTEDCREVKVATWVAERFCETSGRDFDMRLDDVQDLPDKTVLEPPVAPSDRRSTEDAPDSVDSGFRPAKTPVRGRKTVRKG